MKTRPRRPWWAFAAAIVLLPIGGVAVTLAGSWLAVPAVLPGVAATFDAPVVILRAATAGRVTLANMMAGQPVEPGTVLMTIHTDAAPDPAAAALAAHIAEATDRGARLDALLAAPFASTDEGRARQLDLRRRRRGAELEADHARAALAELAESVNADTVVTAGLNGRMLAMDVSAGADVPAGTALARLLDCDHASVALPASAAFGEGQTVELMTPGSPPVLGTVRPASGGNMIVVPKETPDGACRLGPAVTVVALARNK